MSLIRLTSCPAFTFNRVFSLICRSPKNYTLCSHKVLYNRVLVARYLSQKAEAIGSEGTIKAHVDESRPKFVITYDELSSQISKETVQLFDVRSIDDVKSTGSIPGSVNIPLADLKKSLILSDSEFFQKYGVSKPKTSDSNVIFYGLSDVSSSSACEIAHSLGYKRAKYYLKGWTEWSTMRKK
ncbi:unnamed protein product [Schistosoma rodhaini]|uniref:Rhodanese domain-containing protein n=1 Tax=Schistosoma rodhaini TaxID=6188 RepID=A0AA85F063_9TREM|nr:unnamed protein product [Schistosoma rodhaini]